MIITTIIIIIIIKAFVKPHISALVFIGALLKQNKSTAHAVSLSDQLCLMLCKLTMDCKQSSLCWPRQTFPGLQYSVIFLDLHKLCCLFPANKNSLVLWRTGHVKVRQLMQFATLFREVPQFPRCFTAVLRTQGRCYCERPLFTTQSTCTGGGWEVSWSSMHILSQYCDQEIHLQWWCDWKRNIKVEKTKKRCEWICLVSKMLSQASSMQFVSFLQFVLLLHWQEVDPVWVHERSDPQASQVSQSSCPMRLVPPDSNTCTNGWTATTTMMKSAARQVGVVLWAIMHGTETQVEKLYSWGIQKLTL